MFVVYVDSLGFIIVEVFIFVEFYGGFFEFDKLWLLLKYGII